MRRCRRGFLLRPLLVHWGLPVQHSQVPHWLVLSRLAVPVARSALRPKRSMKPRSQSRNRNAEVVAKNWVSRRLSFELVRRLACAHASLKVDLRRRSLQYCAKVVMSAVRFSRNWRSNEGKIFALVRRQMSVGPPPLLKMPEKIGSRIRRLTRLCRQHTKILFLQ